MGSLDGGSPACPGCGGPAGRACACVGQNALLGFLADFSRAASEPPPEPERPHRRSTRLRTCEDAPAADQFDQEIPPGPDGPLPVWPPPPPPPPDPPLTPDQPDQPDPPPTGAGAGDPPARQERRGLLRRLRA